MNGTNLEAMQYRLTILAGGLHGVGLSLAELAGSDGAGVSRHTEALGNAVESLGHYAELLATELERAK